MGKITGTRSLDKLRLSAEVLEQAACEPIAVVDAAEAPWIDLLSREAAAKHAAQISSVTGEPLFPELRRDYEARYGALPMLGRATKAVA